LLPEPPDTPRRRQAAERESDRRCGGDALPALDYATGSRGRAGPPAGALDRWAVFALPLLLLALIAQAAFHFRDALAATSRRPSRCWSGPRALLGCSVGPLQESSGLSIDRTCRRTPRIAGC
jgi:hypothetical protein